MVRGVGRGLRSVLLGTMFLMAALLPISPVAAPPAYPTVTLTVHRIIAVDPVEIIPFADWLYFVGVDEGSGYQWQGSGDLPDDDDDLIVDRDHFFSVQSENVTIAIVLCEEDFLIPPDDDLADISDDSNGEQDNVECSLTPSTPPPGAFVSTWNLSTDALFGDTFAIVSGYFEADGRTDGSTVADENDARLQFLVTDDYLRPQAEAGPPLTGDILEPVAFNASASTASTGSSLLLYEWDFGDGGKDSSTSPLTSHQYNSKDTFIVTLWVTDSIGVRVNGTTTVDIVNLPPEASFAYSPAANITTATGVAFSDSSLEPDGSIASWLWDFGDGETSTDRNPSHRYGDDGNFTVTLTVTDDDDAADMTTQWVEVSNVDPVASFTLSPVNPVSGDVISFVDTSADPDGTIVSWSWDFGDGESSTSRNTTHAFTQKGDYTVVLTVTDDDGGVESVEIAVHVVTPEERAAADLMLALLLAIIVIVFLAALYLWWRSSKNEDEL